MEVMRKEGAGASCQQLILNTSNRRGGAEIREDIQQEIQEIQEEIQEIQEEIQEIQEELQGGGASVVPAANIEYIKLREARPGVF